jgi:hypothetical protein
VPSGYFEELPAQLLDKIRREEVRTELESISPLLNSVSRQVPYSTPNGYFEAHTSTPVQKPGRIVSIASRRWLRYVAAAAVVGAFFWLKPGQVVQNPTTAANNVIQEYQKDIQSLDEQQKSQLSEFMAAGMTGQETTQASNIPSLQPNLLADVSEQEINEFFEQSEYITASSVNP